MSEQTKIPFTASLAAVTITTDGGCWPNPGNGAWACVLRFGAHCKEISGCVSNTTNNEMELKAIAEGFLALKKPCFVTVRTDSQCCIGLLNGTGMKPAKRKHQHLVQVIVAEMQKHKVVGLWVRGHNGDPDNERCDLLCEKTYWANRKASHRSVKPSPQIDGR